MSSGLIALLAGTALAVGALAFVLYPLFFEGRAVTRRAVVPADASESAIIALREIEFDRATGKLSESDYNELKSTYSTRALAEMRAAGVPAQAPVEVDPVEARVRAYRDARKECGTCGLRPEPDAIYCSTCGSYLDARCPNCSAAVAESSAAYCSTCGFVLAGGRERALA
jgi:hypothetical protein